ncbi:hypothetical protein EKO27_g10298 [Xylaria grammica]|uniref:Uncharacterized protein n=1 Tax=Xylaria grammica TaxID=363999 RepID=A0A439CRN9_9PEZI|nr:hypothetical protein EKO27_g10298 [Xylaria grammica]
MPMPRSLSEHPTPAQAYELGVVYAAILRHVFTHPEFHYLEPPTAAISKIDHERTPRGLFFTADFIQNTYIKNVLPFLPAGATRKCKELGNAWAYADATYQWEWTWDAEAGAMKDANGNVVEFPRLSASQLTDNITDLTTRNFFAKKLILENETDLKAKIMLGNRTIDFGEDARAAARKLD